MKAVQYPPKYLALRGSKRWAHARWLGDITSLSSEWGVEIYNDGAAQGRRERTGSVAPELFNESRRYRCKDSGSTEGDDGHRRQHDASGG